MELNQNIFQNNENSYIKVYTKLQINTMFTWFFGIAKEYEENIKKINTIENRNSEQYKMLYTKIVRQKETILYLYSKIQYILEHPDRIKIISVPIKGILRQYKNVQEKNKESQKVMENLKTIFENVRYKIGTEQYLPSEYSTYELDLEIYKQKQKIEKLKKILNKLKKVESPTTTILNSIMSFFNVDCEEDKRLQNKKLQQQVAKIDLQNIQQQQQMTEKIRNFDKKFFTKFVKNLL